MSMRLNYTASRDLTFEFYGQPFVSTGTYSDFREVSATPDDENYDARYQPYVPPADTDRGFAGFVNRRFEKVRGLYQQAVARG